MGPSTATSSSGGVPPVLPPSVEEAYRRKCVQLRTRQNEVEDTNDAIRLRLARTHRGIEKMRLERAFLLEQLAKRTSTNVEDSEGSPSPPPTPKEKPLRVKRGHRKPSFLQDANSGPGFPNNPNAPTLSPSSESFSHQNPNRDPLPMPNSNRPRASVPNGSALRPSPTKKFPSAWDIFASSTRARLTADHQKALAEGTYEVDKTKSPYDVDQELASLWSRMDDQQKNYWYSEQSRVEQSDRDKIIREQERAHWERNAATPRAASQDMSHEEGPPRPRGGGFVGYEPLAPPPQAMSMPSAERPPIVKREEEDVEMQDEADAAPPEAEGGGFTAINRH